MCVFKLSQIKLSDLATCSPSSTVRLEEHGTVAELPGRTRKALTVDDDDRSDFTQIRPVSVLFTVSCLPFASWLLFVAAVLPKMMDIIRHLLVTSWLEIPAIRYRYVAG